MFYLNGKCTKYLMINSNTYANFFTKKVFISTTAAIAPSRASNADEENPHRHYHGWPKQVIACNNHLKEFCSGHANLKPMPWLV